MSNVLQFPEIVKDMSAFTDKDMLMHVMELLLSETDYAEVSIICLREDNGLDCTQSEGNLRTVETLDRAIEEIYLGE